MATLQTSLLCKSLAPSLPAHRRPALLLRQSLHLYPPSPLPRRPLRRILPRALLPDNGHPPEQTIEAAGDVGIELEGPGGEKGGALEVGDAEGEEARGKFSVMVFLAAVAAAVRRGLERAAVSGWLSWWPFWRREKRLERLIAEADADPMDAAKQGALLAELNKHRF